MSERNPWTYLKVMLLSLGLGAMACGLPDLGGSQSSEGVTPTESAAASPTSTPLPVEQPAPTQAASAASGVCKNAYYPVVLGATWSYEVTGGPSGTTSYTDSITSIDGDSFILTTVIGDVTRTQRWSCTADGLVALDFGGASATLVVADMQAVFDTTGVTGVTLPSDPAPGDTWSQTFALEGTQTLPGDQTASVQGQVKYDSTAGQIESVTVPAGSFQALRVDGTSSMSMDVLMSGFTVPMTVSGTIARWYAPDVGYVRWVDKTNFLDTELEITTELTDYSIP